MVVSETCNGGAARKGARSRLVDTEVTFKSLCIWQSIGSSGFVTAAASRSEVTVSIGPAVEIVHTRLAKRLSGLPRIDQISRTGMPGLDEVRLGTDPPYGEADASRFSRGELVEIRGKRNLTRERIVKRRAIDFDKLPLRDAIVWNSALGSAASRDWPNPTAPTAESLKPNCRGSRT